MAEPQHPVERRTSLLASRLTEQVGLIREMLGPRPLFSERLSKPEALAWWRAHRYDSLGARVLDTYKPEDVLGLDVEMGRVNEAEMMGGFGDGYKP